LASLASKRCPKQLLSSLPHPPQFSKLRGSSGRMVRDEGKIPTQWVTGGCARVCGTAPNAVDFFHRQRFRMPIAESHIDHLHMARLRGLVPSGRLRPCKAKRRVVVVTERRCGVVLVDAEVVVKGGGWKFPLERHPSNPHELRALQ